jgi:hypothetical protein
MTRNELRKELYALVGDMRKVDQIFALFGKLSPEPNSGNLRSAIPNYNKHLVKKVRPKLVVSPEHKAKAKEILRRMGMI